MTEEVLRRSPLFAAMPDEALADLVAAGEEVLLDHGSILMAEGEPTDAMYLIQAGELAIFKRTGDTDVLVNVVGAGELIGELGLIQRRPRNATVTARTDARLLRIGAEALDRLLAHPGITRALLHSITERLDRQELILRHHERMAALGMLTAGLLHELNNPAAAVQRSIAHLRDTLATWQTVNRALDDPVLADRLAAMVESPREAVLSPLARADARDAMRARLEALGFERAWELAPSVFEIVATPAQLDDLLADISESARADALEWLASRGRLVRLLGEAATGAARISEIVTSVKSYSHETDTPSSDVDVHEGIEQALTLLRHKLTESIEVVRDYADDLPVIEGHAGDLNSVWTNLLDNAIDAMEEVGILTIRTGSQDDEIWVEIANTGDPIPPETLEHLFDPFFTTKPVGQGTGLGLSTAFSIVTQLHHGRITIEPTETGTLATVKLPTHLPDDRP